MSDIVERLRAAASHPRNQHGPHEFLTDAADEIERLRAALRDEPTQEQIYNACMSYRHDFGLLSVDERKIVAFTAKEWLRAWQKTLARAALGEKA